MRVIFTPAADRQVERLYTYIEARSSNEIADRYIGRLIAFCENLAVFPLRGTARGDLLPGLRTVGFERRMTVAFVVTPEVVLIEGVFYGGRNFEADFAARK